MGEARPKRTNRVKRPSTIIQNLRRIFQILHSESLKTCTSLEHFKFVSTKHLLFKIISIVQMPRRVEKSNYMKFPQQKKITEYPPKIINKAPGSLI